MAKEYKGSITYLVKDVAKDYVKRGTTCQKCLYDMIKSWGRGGTTCMKCLDDMTKSFMERYVEDIEYGSQEERCTNNDASCNIDYKSYVERCANDDQYKSSMERYVDNIEYKFQEKNSAQTMMCHTKLSTSPTWRGAQTMSSPSLNINLLNT